MNASYLDGVVVEIERLEREVACATGDFAFWPTDDLIWLMGEIIGLQKSQCLTPDEESRLKAAERTLGEFLVKMVLQRTETIFKDYVQDKIKSLVRMRNRLKDERLPDWVKAKLRPTLTKVYDALNANSAREAENIVCRIEECLGSAEQNAANGNLPAEGRLHTVLHQASLAEDLIGQFRKHKHLQFVGLPAVARKRNVSVEQLLASLSERGKALQAQESELRRQVAYEIEHAAEIVAQKRAEFEQKRRQRELLEQEERRSQTTRALEARCPRAKGLAAKFYENLRIGDLPAAWNVLGEIRRLDGGFPAQMQEDYRKAAEKTPLREIGQ